MKTRILSGLLALVMVLGSVPVTALAAESDGLCPHHTEHTADCGYVEAVAGVPCDMGCTAGEDGKIVHAPGCAYCPATEGAPCNHVCDETCGGVTAPAQTDETTEPVEPTELTAETEPVPTEEPTPTEEPAPTEEPVPTEEPEPTEATVSAEELLQTEVGTVSAQGEGLLTSGSCGNSLNFTLTRSGVLTITGSGAMRTYFQPSGVPWNRYRDVITEVKLPSGLTDIAWFAFQNCTALTSITIPYGVKEIGIHAFDGCTALSAIDLPSSVRTIGNYAFQKCNGLTTLVLPKGVTTIETFVFADCKNLTKVTIPQGVDSIGLRTFAGCKNLTEVNLLGSIPAVGADLFRGCWGLKSIRIPDGFKTISSGMFTYCYNLQSVILPNSVTAIKDDAFLGCEALESINLPSGLTAIDAGAFSGCKALTSIVIPNSVNSIGDSAFVDCTSLKTVRFQGDGFTGSDSIFSAPVTAYYPEGNATWTQAIRDSFGSYVSWAIFCAHSPVTKAVKQATLTDDGCKAHYECSKCGEWFTDVTCTEPVSQADCTIPKVKTATLSTTEYTYTGGVKTPTVTVTDAVGHKLVRNTDYTVTYPSGRKYVGTYTVTVKGKGNYSFTKTVRFKILPPKAAISKLTAKMKGFVAQWSRKTSQVDGYQIQFSLKSNFSSPKTKTITKNTTTSVTISSQLANRTYYVRIRTYKTVGKTKYYSAWSSTTKVRTK